VVFLLHQTAVACSNNKIRDVSNGDVRSDRRRHFSPYLLTIHVTDLVTAKPNDTLPPAQVIRSVTRNDETFMNDVLERLQSDKVIIYRDLQPHCLEER
jgi:hypothetical protein